MKDRRTVTLKYQTSCPELKNTSPRETSLVTAPRCKGLMHPVIYDSVSRRIRQQVAPSERIFGSIQIINHFAPSARVSACKLGAKAIATNELDNNIVHLPRNQVIIPFLYFADFPWWKNFEKKRKGKRFPRDSENVTMYEAWIDVRVSTSVICVYLSLHTKAFFFITSLAHIVRYTIFQVSTRGSTDLLRLAPFFHGAFNGRFNAAFYIRRQHPPPRCPRHDIPPSLCRQCRIVDVKSPLWGSIPRLRKVLGTCRLSTFLRVRPDRREEFTADLCIVAGDSQGRHEAHWEIRPRKSDSARVTHVEGVVCVDRSLSSASKLLSELLPRINPAKSVELEGPMENLDI